jgi:hypothetical protein
MRRTKIREIDPISRIAVFDGVDAPQRPRCATVEVLRSTT